MTEREELVERVATAILRRRAQEDYHTVDDHGAWVVDHDKELARAAIAECERDRTGQTADEMIANVREIIGEMAWGVGLPSPFVMLEPILPMSEDAPVQVTTKQIALRKEQIEPIFGAIYSRLLKDGPPDFVGKERERANKLEAQCAAMRAALEGLYGACELHANQEGGDFGPIIGPAAEAAQSALSPDAGRKVLDVVRETEYLVENIREHGVHDNWKGVANALSALGWEP